MGKKILIVLTSVDKIPSTGNPTGWYLPELAHPYKILIDAGLKDIDFITPKGGISPVDPGSIEAFKDDPVCHEFLNDPQSQKLVKTTKMPADVKPSDYCAVLYPGGHGPMFDLAQDSKVAAITAAIYDNGGVVAAVCHGPAGLIPVKLSNGDPLIKGKKLTSFTNSEEKMVGLTDAMPFPLQSKLTELGATFQDKDDFAEHFVVDGRLITGQNPASSTAFGHALVAQLKSL